MTADDRIPVTVITGFLGSGKTTLLQRLLEREEASRAAVLINEFGEVALDHLLVRPVSGDTVVLRNGCICCSVRSELRDGLRDILDSRDKGAVPPFDRIVIETTGLADPVPLVQTLAADQMLRHRIRLTNLIATVDALNGMHELSSLIEARRQVATADRLVLTKTDLSSSADIATLEKELRSINSSAPVVDASDDAKLWPALLASDPFDPSSKGEEVRSWFEQSDPLSPFSCHDDTVHSFVFRTSRRVDWTAFAVWLSLLVHRHGRNVLRVKGLLNVPGAAGPVCLNAVQKFIHPPVHLDAWPSDDRSSRLVFIVQGLSARSIRASLDRMLALADGTVGRPHEAV